MWEEPRLHPAPDPQLGTSWSRRNGERGQPPVGHFSLITHTPCTQSWSQDNHLSMPLPWPAKEEVGEREKCPPRLWTPIQAVLGTRGRQEEAHSGSQFSILPLPPQLACQAQRGHGQVIASTLELGRGSKAPTTGFPAARSWGNPGCARCTGGSSQWELFVPSTSSSVDLPAEEGAWLGDHPKSWLGCGGSKAPTESFPTAGNQGDNLTMSPLQLVG